MLTPDALKAIFPTCPNPAVWAPAISAAWERYGFSTPEAQAGYLAIIGNETGGLRETKRENMNYSPSRARLVFGPTRAARCEQYCTLDENGRRVRNDNGQAFASCIYDGMLGNIAAGDGWRYRGNGIPQLTGRENHRRSGQAIGVDLEGDPDLLWQDPAVNALCAAEFMAHAGMLPLLDTGKEKDFLAAAAKHGYPAGNTTATRLAYWRKALDVLRMTAATKVTATGNVVIKDIDQSTIIRDSNRGLSAATITTAMGAAAPIVTATAGMDWRVAAVLAAFVLLAGAGVAYYLLRVKKARRQMHAAGIV